MDKRKKNITAVVLLSGGLDSMLAVRILQAQNIEVEALSFRSNFYDTKKASAAARNLGVKLHIIDIGKEMLELVKNPPSGYGKNLNPCIDCHAMMFRQAVAHINNNNDATSPVNEPGSHGAGPLPPSPPPLSLRRTSRRGIWFLASGEVLGQRPFSQNKSALGRVEKLSGQEILRPLSAKLLTETALEKRGIVNRQALYDIQGRTRERQMELAKKFGIGDYPSPAGGCLLTDPGFSVRLRKMLEFWPDCKKEDVELLKFGRVFWLAQEKNNKTLVIVGRDEKDNEKLEELAQTGDFVVKLKEELGPSTLVRIRGKEFAPGNKESEISQPEAGPSRTENQEPGNFEDFDTLAVIVPMALAEINVNKKFDSPHDLLLTAGKLTGYHAPKLRGREVAIAIRNVKYKS